MPTKCEYFNFIIFNFKTSDSYSGAHKELFAFSFLQKGVETVLASRLPHAYFGFSSVMISSIDTKLFDIFYLACGMKSIEP